VFHTSYTYDPFGNRLTKTHNGAVSHYEYDAANTLSRLIAPDGAITSFVHDENGNLIAKKNENVETIYDWDAGNHLVSLKNELNQEEYVYNFEGLRVSKKTGDATKQFIWDGRNLLAELDDNGKTVEHYTDAPGEWGNLTSVTGNGLTQYFAFDLSSNTRYLSNAEGNIVSNFVFDAFGVALTDISASATPYRFGGQYGYHTDSEEAVYVRARHYSTSLGRWINPDPTGFRSGDWNLHRYVKNAAGMQNDPSGLATGLTCGPAAGWSCVKCSKKSGCTCCQYGTNGTCYGTGGGTGLGSTCGTVARCFTPVNCNSLSSAGADCVQLCTAIKTKTVDSTLVTQCCIESMGGGVDPEACADAGNRFCEVNPSLCE
jgi:RHS repeat-associated protein